MFLDEPSGVSGQYGTVAKRVGNEIFKPADKPIIYYSSSLALYKIENLFKTHKIDKKYRRSRYHAMMLFRMIVSEGDMPRFNARAMEEYCQRIVNILENDSECQRIFSGIVSYIDSVGNEIQIEDRKCFERKETTEFLKAEIAKIKTYVDNYQM